MDRCDDEVACRWDVATSGVRDVKHVLAGICCKGSCGKRCDCCGGWDMVQVGAELERSTRGDGGEKVRCERVAGKEDRSRSHIRKAQWRLDGMAAMMRCKEKVARM